MDFLNNRNISYAIISGANIDSLFTMFHIKDYNIIPITKYFKGMNEDSIIVYKTIDNNDLRFDIISLLDQFKEDSAIVKYLGDDNPVKLSSDGSERPLRVVKYNTDDENVSYLYNGLSFSFIAEKVFWKPKIESDFRKGMIVEYYNKNKWNKHLVREPKKEYKDLFEMLIKYDKVRIERSMIA